MSTTMLDRRDEVREWCIRKGWRGVKAPSRTFGDDMALLHSEVSEMLEAYRDHKLDRYSVWDDGMTLVGASKQSVKMGSFDYHKAKPEGVAAELGDVLIRLLDNYAEWEIRPPEDNDIWVDPNEYKSFGDAIDALHNVISSCSQGRSAYSEMSADFLREITAELFDRIMEEIHKVAKFYEIHLAGEYRAKMDYNETRAFRHGGKGL